MAARLSNPRTLVVSPNWVGDVVMALPTLDALAASGRTLTVLAKPHLLPLLDLTPSVAAVIGRSDNRGDTIAELASGQFDEAVVLPNSFHSAWLPFRAGIPKRWGYRGDWRRLLLSPAVARPRVRSHQVRDYAALLDRMGLDLPQDVPYLELGNSHRELGRSLLQRAGLEDGPTLALFPGAEFGPSKRWPLDHFADLSQRARKAFPEMQQVILAGPKEVWIGVRLHEETGKIHPVVGPDLDLAELAAVITCVDAMVTNDSGPMHLAAALGKPCVSLFGPTNPDRTAPYGPEHQVLTADRWCSPCFRRRCPLLHHRCLKEISPERAARALSEVYSISNSGSPPSTA